ncbi:MAG TPA: hypothetical protein VGK73_20070, partial [Polyangiaceae bacterium]
SAGGTAGAPSAGNGGAAGSGAGGMSGGGGAGGSASASGAAGEGGEGDGAGTGGAGEPLVPYGLEERPANASCLAFARPTGEPGDAFPRSLSTTGCFEAGNPTRPSAGLIPYEVNASLYSDGATKSRWLALPDEAPIEVLEDGDFELPVGSVLVKLFELEGAPIETRLFMRHEDGEWAGYSYAWLEDGSDAELLETTVSRLFGDQEWIYPSRENCLECHTAAAGHSLGLELAQLNRAVEYPLGRSNQLRTLEHIGLFAEPLPSDPLPALPEPSSTGATTGRARAYLHANCANCHRPGGTSEVTLDLRFETSIAGMLACEVEPSKGSFGITGAKLLKPGDPERSMIAFRMHTSIAGVRMPPIGRTLPDTEGGALIDAWIAALAGCP